MKIELPSLLNIGQLDGARPGSGPPGGGDFALALGQAAVAVDGPVAVALAPIVLGPRQDPAATGEILPLIDAVDAERRALATPALATEGAALASSMTPAPAATATITVTPGEDAAAIVALPNVPVAPRRHGPATPSDVAARPLLLAKRAEVSHAAIVAASLSSAPDRDPPLDEATPPAPDRAGKAATAGGGNDAADPIIAQRDPGDPAALLRSAPLDPAPALAPAMPSEALAAEPSPLGPPPSAPSSERAEADVPAAGRPSARQQRELPQVDRARSLPRDGGAPRERAAVRGSVPAGGAPASVAQPDPPAAAAGAEASAIAAGATVAAASSDRPAQAEARRATPPGTGGESVIRDGRIAPRASVAHDAALAPAAESPRSTPGSPATRLRAPAEAKAAPVLIDTASEPTPPVALARPASAPALPGTDRAPADDGVAAARRGRPRATDGIAAAVSVLADAIANASPQAATRAQPAPAPVAHADTAESAGPVVSATVTTPTPSAVEDVPLAPTLSPPAPAVVPLSEAQGRGMATELAAPAPAVAPGAPMLAAAPAETPTPHSAGRTPRQSQTPAASTRADPAASAGGAVGTGPAAPPAEAARLAPAAVAPTAAGMDASRSPVAATAASRGVAPAAPESARLSVVAPADNAAVPRGEREAQAARIDAAPVQRRASEPAIPQAAPQRAAQLFAAAMFAADRAPDRRGLSRAQDDAVASLTPGMALGAPTTAHVVHAPSAARDAAVDLSRHDWMGAMIDRIETLRDEAGGVRETRIRLMPDALGQVDVSVHRDSDGALRISITADTPQARQILADAAPRLADMAEARGLKLGGGQADGASQQQANNTPHQGGQHAQRAPQAPRSARTAANDLPADDAEHRIA